MSGDEIKTSGSRFWRKMLKIPRSLGGFFSLRGKKFCNDCAEILFLGQPIQRLSVSGAKPLYLLFIRAISFAFGQYENALLSARTTAKGLLGNSILVPRTLRVISSAVTLFSSFQKCCQMILCLLFPTNSGFCSGAYVVPRNNNFPQGSAEHASANSF